MNARRHYDDMADYEAELEQCLGKPKWHERAGVQLFAWFALCIVALALALSLMLVGTA